MRQSTGEVRVLVTGFGPFRDVVDNPSARLARALDGQRAGRARVTGTVLPVTYRDGPAGAIALAERLDAAVVIGLGRHPTTPVPRVEVLGVNAGDGADVTGVVEACLEADGPDHARTNLDAVAFAEAIGGAVTEDAGRYVCNAWVYKVSRALAPRRTVGFVHVPPDGMDADVLLGAIGALWGQG